MVHEANTEENVSPKTCYKVVAWKKPNDGFYSIAMGFKYRKGKVPTIQKQKKICRSFNDILPKIVCGKDKISDWYKKYTYSTNGFRWFYKGKTAGFSNLEDAIDYARDNKGGLIPGYDLVIVKIILSGTVWNAGEADYGPMYIGSHMKIDRVIRWYD